MKEIYKPIIGYEDLYEISNCGNVRTVLGKTTESVRHGTRVWKQRVLKPRILSSSGHLRVSLYKNKIGTDFLIHRLVAQAFIPNPNNYSIINHKDSDPTNNNVENLEWCTSLYNNEYALQYKERKDNIFVTLKNRQTGDLIEFNSMSKASQFLSYNHGWISNTLKRGVQPKDKNYDIIIQERRNRRENGN